MITPDSPLLSTPSGTREQCVKYICSKPHGEYSDYDIGQIVKSYFETCDKGGSDPVMVIAQMIHETGCLTSWFSQRPRRNPAGIGVTGRKLLTPNKPKGSWEHKDGIWLEGIAFKSWATESVPAHVGRLLAYALHDGQGTTWQHHLIADALAVRPLPLSYRGAAPTWRGLNGRWATPGLTYIQNIIRIQEAITK